MDYSEYVEVYVKAHHFCKIHISGKLLEFEAVSPDGTVIDSFTLAHLIPGDIDLNWEVNWVDLKAVGDWWLQRCRVGEWCEGADINQDGGVNLADFGILAEHWLEIAP